MTPQKLPDGRWRLRVAVTVDGVQRRKQFTADKRADVIRLATDWLRDAGRPASEMTVAEAARKYLDAKAPALSPATVRRLEYVYSGHISRIQTPLDRFDSLAAQEWIGQLMASGLRSTTVSDLWKQLKTILSFYRPEQVWRVKLPQRQPREILVPDDTLMREVFAAVKGTDLELAVALAATIPARSSEVLALTAEDFNGRTVTINKAAVLDKYGHLVIKAPKTAAGIRTAKIPDSVARLVHDGTLVPYSTPTGLTRAFQRCLNRHGLPRLRFHALRHYGASVMLSMGIPFKEVQRRGGWESAATLQDIYAHALADQIPVADQRIGEHFDRMIK